MSKLSLSRLKKEMTKMTTSFIKIIIKTIVFFQFIFIKDNMPSLGDYNLFLDHQYIHYVHLLVYLFPLLKHQVYL